MIKQKFDPKDKIHLTEFSFFLKNKKWKTGCRFELEWPYVDIPSMIKHKIVQQHIDGLIKFAT